MLNTGPTLLTFQKVSLRGFWHNWVRCFPSYFLNAVDRMGPLVLYLFFFLMLLIFFLCFHVRSNPFVLMSCVVIFLAQKGHHYYFQSIQIKGNFFFNMKRNISSGLFHSSSLFFLTDRYYFSPRAKNTLTLHFYFHYSLQFPFFI